MTNENTPKTTERSLRLIDLIQTKKGATLKELSEELGIGKSTVHRHLKTLRKYGYVVKEGEFYHIGLRFLNHGEFARLRKPAYRLVSKTVSTLANQTDEEVQFVVENYGRGITIYESLHRHHQYGGIKNELHDEADLTDSSRQQKFVGSYDKLHTIAAGKAILAELPAERVEEIIEQWGLPERTDKTITEKKALFDELDRIRKDGFSYTDEEYEVGLRAVGRSVTYPDGSIIGAISVFGPKYRLVDSVFEDKFPSLIRDAVDNLEREIESELRNRFAG